TSACIFSVILHRNSLLGASPAASFLYNLTKNLTAHLHHQLCAVLPKRITAALRGASQWA
ncbi:MAG: hypothetical protein IKN55_05130, partial [Oscillospiraceae bacterium]|nr:hypothetical protein [Oscillospiraceae bacterium]